MLEYCNLFFDSKGFVYEHAVDNVILRPRGGVLKSPLFAGLGLAGLDRWAFLSR